MSDYFDHSSGRNVKSFARLLAIGRTRVDDGIIHRSEFPVSLESQSTVEGSSPGIERLFGRGKIVASRVALNHEPEGVARLQLPPAFHSTCFLARPLHTVGGGNSLLDLSS